MKTMMHSIMSLDNSRNYRTIMLLKLLINSNLHKLYHKSQRMNRKHSMMHPIMSLNKSRYHRNSIRLLKLLINLHQINHKSQRLIPSQSKKEDKMRKKAQIKMRKKAQTNMMMRNTMMKNMTKKT